jgi:hypothetical protein
LNQHEKGILKIRVDPLAEKTEMEGLVLCHLLCLFLDLPGGSSIAVPSALNAHLFFFSAGQIKLNLKSLFPVYSCHRGVLRNNTTIQN